ncbi:hypothetical protein OSTOST_05925 [Ostertagia ostertagi]
MLITRPRNQVSDEMSAASASAYSWSESEELITVGNADDIYNEMVDTRTAILDESEDERFDESDLSTAILDDDEDLITAVSHDYSAYSLPASETFVDMDDIEPNSVKTAEMEVSAYTPPPSETDVDMSRTESLQNHSEDVVGGASPMSTAVTGSISWYSMPPSETNVELPTSMGGDRSKFVEAVRVLLKTRCERRGYCQQSKVFTTQMLGYYLEGLALNESAVGSELNKAFLEAEETDKERTDGDKDPYDFDTAIEA